MAFAVVFPGSSQGDALIEQAAVAHHGGFTDHYTHAMVNEHPTSDGGARMDLYAGQATAELA